MCGSINRVRHSTPAGRQGRQSVGSILHRMGRVPASGRMPRACMGVHVLSSTTTVVGVGWFSMAMCVVYVDAWSHAMCHAPAHVRARTSREGGTDSPSRPLLGRCPTAWMTRESAAQSRLPIAFREVRMRCYLRLACDWRNHQTNRSQ